MTAHLRGWRFLLPGLDAPGPRAGLQPGVAASVAMVDDEEAIRQSLLMLVSTRPGERVMRPEYGCDLNRVLFAPNDDTTAGLAIHYVRRAVERWEPRVEILRVDATRAVEDPTALDVVLEYRVRATRRTATLTVPVVLEPGATA